MRLERIKEIRNAAERSVGARTASLLWKLLRGWLTGCPLKHYFVGDVCRGRRGSSFELQDGTNGPGCGAA